MAIDTNGLARDHAPARPREKAHHRRNIFSTGEVPQGTLTLVNRADVLGANPSLLGIALNHALYPLSSDAPPGKAH